MGEVVFDADRAVEWAKAGRQVILVRAETSPEDVAGMYAAEGIVTSRGGRTSHAAVVAVGMGKPCVVGAGDVVVSEERRTFEAGGRTVREGDIVSRGRRDRRGDPRRCGDRRAGSCRTRSRSC